MKKLLVAIFILALLAFGAFWVFVDFGSTSVPTNDSGDGRVTLPGSSSVPASSSGSSFQEQSSNAIIGIGGVVISARDFLHASSTGQYPTAGYYYLGYHAPLQGITDPTATENPPYIIEYISATQYFNISLLQEPIGSVREEVQQYLMTMLGISQDQMCRLNYSLGVPVRVNTQFAGTNLGFSFCPGAVTLPR